MTIIGYLRKITGNKDLKWESGGCEHVHFELNGRNYSLLKRTALKRTNCYQLNVDGERPTPWWITESWATILKRLEAKISSNIVK